MESREEGLSQSKKVESINYSTVNKAIQTALHTFEIEKRPQRSKNLVFPFQLGEMTYYAKEINIIDKNLEKTNPELARIKKLEDGTTQVLCHQLLNKVLGEQQPVSYLYQGGARVFLVTPAVKYEKKNELSSKFAEELAVMDLLQTLKTQILKLPQNCNDPELANEIIQSLLASREKLLGAYTAIIQTTLEKAVEKKAVEKEALEKEVVEKEVAELLSQANTIIDEVMDKHKVKLSDRNINEELFVKLLCMMMLLAESDCNLNNIFLIEKENQSFHPIMIDTDLILSRLNNNVQDMAASKAVFDLYPKDLTAKGLLNPEGHHPKLWLDSILNFLEGKTIIAFGALNDSEVKPIVNKVMLDLLDELKKMDYQTLLNFQLLDPTTHELVGEIIKQHIDICKEYITNRVTTVQNEKQYKDSENPIATRSMILERNLIENQRLQALKICAEVEKAYEAFKNIILRTPKPEKSIFGSIGRSNKIAFENLSLNFFNIINDYQNKPSRDLIEKLDVMLEQYKKISTNQLYKQLDKLTTNLKTLSNMDKKLEPFIKEQLDAIFYKTETPAPTKES